MTYNDVLSMSKTDEELTLNLRTFYMDEIEVLKWMEDNGVQNILFNDRIVRKENGQYHSLDGPAITKNENAPEHIREVPADMFFIEGENMPYDEWKPEATVRKRKKILNKLKKSGD